MRSLFVFLSLVLFMSCEEQASFSLENYPDFEVEIKSDSSFAELILSKRPQYVTDPIFEFKEEFQEGDLDPAGMLIREKIKKEYGKIAWEQIVDLENLLIVPINYVTTHTAELTAILYVTINQSPSKYKLISTEELRTIRHRSGLMNLYDLGYYSYFQCKVPQNRDCKEEQFYRSARKQYLTK